MNPILRHLLRQYLYVFALCCAIAVLTTLMWPHHGYAVQLGYALCIGTVCWSVIVIGRQLTPARHCHASDDGMPGWPRGWRGLVLVVAGILVGYFGGDWLAGLLLGSTSPGRQSDARDNAVGLYITFGAGALASLYFHTRGQASAMAAQIAQAERDASEAKLKLLESQLEPHMLFNTLANLRVLITLDPARATQMLDHLVAFLRATLQASRATEHTLAQEFARLGDYLELMSVRMGPRLRYTLELPSGLASRPVPALLLQPLVENAIQHGLEPRIEGGTVRVQAWEDAGLLRLQVEDDGAGLAEPAPPARRTGFGLQQVRTRLATRYGDRSGLELNGRQPSGTQVRVWLPLEVSPQGPLRYPPQHHSQSDYIQEEQNFPHVRDLAKTGPADLAAN